MLEPVIYIHINDQIKGLLSANGHSVLGKTLVFHLGAPGSIPSLQNLEAFIKKLIMQNSSKCFDTFGIWCGNYKFHPKGSLRTSYKAFPILAFLRSSGNTVVRHGRRQNSWFAILTLKCSSFIRKNNEISHVWRQNPYCIQ